MHVDRFVESYENAVDLFGEFLEFCACKLVSLLVWIVCRGSVWCGVFAFGWLLLTLLLQD